MALEYSKMMPLMTKAPAFELLDVVSNQKVNLDSLKSDKGTVIAFICRHCPYVVLIQKKLAEVAKHYQQLGFQFAAISSNDAAHYPDDAPAGLRIQAAENGFTFPYLYDEDQTTAKAYHAACTPDFFVFDKDLLCVYRGRFDEATPGNQKAVTGADLSQALDAILQDKPISEKQFPSMGCSIKWKK